MAKKQKHKGKHKKRHQRQTTAAADCTPDLLHGASLVTPPMHHPRELPADPAALYWLANYVYSRPPAEVNAQDFPPEVLLELAPLALLWLPIPQPPPAEKAIEEAQAALFEILIWAAAREGITPVLMVTTTVELLARVLLKEVSRAGVQRMLGVEPVPDGDQPFPAFGTMLETWLMQVRPLSALAVRYNQEAAAAERRG